MSPTAARSLCGLATAVEQLAQDITDDAESYQAALPTACGLSLAAIAARHARDLAWRALHLCACLSGVTVCCSVHCLSPCIRSR